VVDLRTHFAAILFIMYQNDFDSKEVCLFGLMWRMFRLMFAYLVGHILQL